MQYYISFLADALTTSSTGSYELPPQSHSSRAFVEPGTPHL
jgi:hypothetical protein